MIDLFLYEQKKVSKDTFIQLFSDLGLKEGDTIMLHSRLLNIGRPNNSVTKEELLESILDAVLKVITERGTLIVPTFTLSFCVSGYFSLEETKSEMGVFSEFVRNHSVSIRTKNPIHSVSIIGAKSSYFSTSSRNTSFGRNSIFDLMHTSTDVKFLTIGFNNPTEVITHIHYIEEQLNVPYRHKKIFNGSFSENGIIEPVSTEFYVRKNPSKQVFNKQNAAKYFFNEIDHYCLGIGNTKAFFFNEISYYDGFQYIINKHPNFLLGQNDR